VARHDELPAEAAEGERAERKRGEPG